MNHNITDLGILAESELPGIGITVIARAVVARSADEICAYILAEYSKSYSVPGAAKLMRRLGFVYKKPQSLPA